MRRRGQSALIVVGAGIVVILLVLITYYLTELVVTNNDDIAKVETAIAITNQLSSKTDAYIKANAPIIALQLPAKLNVSLNQKYDVYTTFEVPFVYCELDVKNGYYSLQNEDVFDNADVRAMYLRKLYENISSSVFYNNGLATVFISGVPYRLINEELLPLFKTPPYEYYYTEDKETINALFLTNHTNFIMLFPNISVQYNPDYVVCYADKRPDVMTFDECMSEDGTVIAPYLRMRNNHQLIVNTTLRPILGYNWLLLKYVAWRWAVNRTFEQKALVIPINYTNYYIFHTDPIATVIPKTLFDGKWHKLNLTDEITGKYEILGGQTSDTSEFGNINTDIYTLENRGIFHNGMRDLLNLITFYPAFPFTKSAHDSYYRPLFFYGANIMDFNKRNYLDVSPFIYPNNILYINKNSLYAQASAYTPDDYDNMLADLLAVSSYDFSRDTSLRDNAYFTSLYAMFRDDYVSKDEYLTQTLPFGVNYIQLLEIGIATNIYSLSNPFSLRLKSLSRFAGLGRPEDLNFLYNYTKRFDDYHLLTKSIPFYGAGISKDYSEELRGEAISISPSDFHGSDLIVDTYLMPLFIPYNDPDSAYGKLVNTKETLPPKRTLEREPPP
ncbi:hypothetical protein [Thermococcus sp. JCM 11816]|uniref:hypothetical protein n=1 Tax=Thermococcus sp. (strain JCM 11816 / KS-1) TaxID=1295125 RepID=UPI0034663400